MTTRSIEGQASQTTQWEQISRHGAYINGPKVQKQSEELRRAVDSMAGMSTVVDRMVVLHYPSRPPQQLTIPEFTTWLEEHAAAMAGISYSGEMPPITKVQAAAPQPNYPT